MYILPNFDIQQVPLKYLLPIFKNNIKVRVSIIFLVRVNLSLLEDLGSASDAEVGEESKGRLCYAYQNLRTFNY